jgi:hypothetical protein
MVQYALLDYNIALKYIFMHIRVHGERNRQHKRWTSLKGSAIAIYTSTNTRVAENRCEELRNTEGVE